MKTHLKILLLGLFTFTFLLGCSLYTSDSREYLKSSGSNFEVKQLSVYELNTYCTKKISLNSDLQLHSPDWEENSLKVFLQGSTSYVVKNQEQWCAFPLPAEYSQEESLSFSLLNGHEFFKL